jgi:TolB-like protein
MKKISVVFIMIFLASALAFSQKVVVVADFTTKDPALEPKMAGLADVLRSELAKSNLIRLVDRTHFEQIFNELAQQRMGFTDPASVKKIGQMLNADYLIAGAITRDGDSASLDVFGPGITASVSMQMIEVETGRIISSAILSPGSWNEYRNKMPPVTRGFISKIPNQAAVTFGGIWEASIQHDGFEDIYEITFLDANRCSVTVFSYDDANIERTQTAEGTYTLKNDVLGVNVNFRRVNTIAHLTRIEWKVIFRLNNERNILDVVIPVSSLPDAKRMRASFQKK